MIKQVIKQAPQRIGLFGGTFDPVHLGHLRTAIELAEGYALNQLRLLPNHRPAHRDQPMASTAQRIEMLEIATQNLPQLVVDPREAMRDTASYTFDTLSEFRLEFPDAMLIFFMGQDAFSEFESWHRWSEILELANLVVIDRPNAQLSDWASNLMAQQAEKLAARIGSSMADAYAGIIERRSVTQLAISATDVRRRIASRQSVDFLVPERVNQYIVKHRLYS